MALKETAFESTIKNKGYWKFSDVYSMLYDFLKNEGYSVNESSYKESSGDSKDIDIEWEASKKVTDYFKYVIAIKWAITGMTDVEVEIDEKVKKMNKGDLKIKVTATFVKDYDSKWEDKPHHKFLRGLYEKYIINSSIDEYKGKLSKEAAGLVDELKAFLKLSA
jgi:hypothetical protein